MNLQLLVTDAIRHSGNSLLLHCLQYHDLPQLRRRGRWTSGTSNVMFKKERSCSIKTGSPPKLQTVSVLSLSSRFVSLQSKTTQSPATSPCSHCVETEEGRGVHSVLRSGVEQQSIAHTCFSKRYLYHLVTWHKNRGQAEDTFDTSTDTLRCIMSPHTYGGRALELP